MDKTLNNVNKELIFYYAGVTNTAQKITGEISAPSMVLAKVALHKRGIAFNKVTKKRQFLFATKSNTISPSDITGLSRQLATLSESGIPLTQAFDIMSKGQANKQIQKLLQMIKQDIETGLTLTNTLRKHPNYFNELFCNLVDAGEQSGSLEVMLNKIASYKEKIETIKKKIKKALAYPLAVLLIAFLVTAGLLIFVVPQFEALFRSFGAELPALTQAVVTLSGLLKSYWYLIIGGLIGLLYAFKYAHNNSSFFKQNMDYVLLKLPVIGSITKKAIIARFARTLAITFAAGLPLLEALKAAGGITGNSIYFKATHYIKEEVSSGQQLNRAMENTQLFPNMVVQMVAVGEESGTLEKMLSKIADFYDEDVDNFVDSLSNLLEPMIMSLLGILVGGLVIAMYLPIFKLGSAL